MKSLPLKYRPKSLQEVVGQNVAVRILSNAFAIGYVANAFLLTGYHGIGKTTLARIIAKSAMCEKGITASPCLECTHCKEIAMLSHPDVIEMDAASNTGVSEVRTVIESANYVPLKGRFKIFVIDEVHMLSVSAFNALLKTLEEPRGHVKFVLATTELKKVPLTVVSRCQLLQLQKVKGEEIVGHLQHILKMEGLGEDKIDSHFLKFIGKASKGSLRDAISILEQVILYSQGGSISMQQLFNLLGFSSPIFTESILNCIISQDAQKMVTELQSAYLQMPDPVILLEDIAELLHELLICKLNRSRCNKEVYIDKIGIERLIRLWQAVLHGLMEVKTAPDCYMALEMLLIRLCFLCSLPSIAEIIDSSQSSKKLEDSPMIKKIMESFRKATISEIW